jgi:hypothetical protein
MDKTIKSFGTMIALGILLVASNAFAGEYTFNTVGAGGYDVVAYHTQNKALRGTGYHAARHEGVTYLFTSKENHDKFLGNPGLYPNVATWGFTFLNSADTAPSEPPWGRRFTPTPQSG